MQQIFDAGCNAQIYAIQGRNFPFPDLTGELCPYCKADLLRKHGFYERYLILCRFEGIVVIRRYICKECGHTVSLLPSFAHPGRTYGIKPIVGVLTAFYADEKYVCKIARVCVCSRQLIRWFRLRIEKNLNLLIMELIEVCALRAPPVTEESAKKRAGQFFECIRRLKAEDISLKIFERTGKTYLSPLPR
jgi:transposase-like protein